MTDQRAPRPLPRPAPAPDRGPLDDRFYDLVEERFVRLVNDNPVLGTALGLHRDDDLVADGRSGARQHVTDRSGWEPARGSPGTGSATTGKHDP